MNTLPPVLKSLVIYVICIPLAVFLGFQVKDLAYMSRESMIIIGIILMVLVSPILLRWHRPLMFFFLNATAFAFFLPGRPRFGLVMVAVSLAISVLQRTVQHSSKFIRASEITRPLWALIIVVVVTMMFRGGLGFSAFGSRLVGGSRYLMLLLGLLSFYALTAQPIPRERASAYVALFFLGGITMVMGDLYAFAPSALHPIFLFFPPSGEADIRSGDVELGVTRFLGVALMCGTIFRYMLARYGLRGIVAGPNNVRLFLFVGLAGIALFGGFRSVILGLLLVFAMMFYLEGLHRTQVVVPILLGGALFMALTIMFLPRMPFTVQRALAFLPVEVDPIAKMSAAGSSEWRVEMWKSLVPELPNYLLLGKGLGVSEEDMEAISNEDMLARSPDHWMWAVITGDFHNGPLSVVLTFGLWGLLAFVWLQIAGARALYANYRHGDPELRGVNTYVFGSYLAQLVMFWFVFGSMYSETVIFVSLLGFSVAINHGVRRPAAAVSTPMLLRGARDRPTPIQPGIQPAGVLAKTRGHET